MIFQAWLYKIFFSRLADFQGQTQEIVTGRRDQTQTKKNQDWKDFLLSSAAQWMTLIKLMTCFHQIFICLLFEFSYEIILVDWDQNSIKNADTADYFVKKRYLKFLKNKN